LFNFVYQIEMWSLWFRFGWWARIRLSPHHRCLIITSNDYYSDTVWLIELKFCMIAQIYKLYRRKEVFIFNQRKIVEDITLKAITSAWPLFPLNFQILRATLNHFFSAKWGWIHLEIESRISETAVQGRRRWGVCKALRSLTLPPALCRAGADKSNLIL
jgi:hypothetical protein